ncbi:hypothetical protein PGT21_012393 [Puccinia graminis f. sp. tritici]|uniref:Uncharacterized protein n=1 Tax=Puccinia graminis f. sp. tritici TaxID=56615 RepID=A0A5B0Q564_PUCGR|nr:hypothetical protein PGT21_012393 [Puccinia graminis f. sp. tritici]
MTPPGYVNQGYSPQPSQYFPQPPGTSGPPAGRKPDWHRPDYRKQNPPQPNHRSSPRPAANHVEPDTAGPTDQHQTPYLLSHQPQPSPSPYEPPEHQPGPMEPVTWMIEIGGLDDLEDDHFQPRFRQLAVGEGDEPVLDTGATHHLTGQRSGEFIISDPEWANRNF